ncbi:MAG: disulfide bond formation protein B [Caulobacter sp.]|nr:disulfide bond formation protein B [Caulobacter sp.]
MTIQNVDGKVNDLRTTPSGSALDIAAANWPLLALIACAAMLGAAHAFETFGKLAPCLMCLKQREVYWVTGTVALGGVVLSRTPWAARLRTPIIVLLGLGFLFGAGVAAFHAGVEWKWWPGPAACAGGGAVASGDLVAMLQGGKVATPSCDKAVWVFLGLSMAGWNAVISLGLAIASFASALRLRKAA